MCIGTGAEGTLAILRGWGFLRSNQQKAEARMRRHWFEKAWSRHVVSFIAVVAAMVATVAVDRWISRPVVFPTSTPQRYVFALAALGAIWIVVEALPLAAESLPWQGLSKAIRESRIRGVAKTAGIFALLTYLRTDPGPVLLFLTGIGALYLRAVQGTQRNLWWLLPADFVISRLVEVAAILMLKAGMDGNAMGLATVFAGILLMLAAVILVNLHFSKKSCGLFLKGLVDRWLAHDAVWDRLWDVLWDLVFPKVRGAKRPKRLPNERRDIWDRAWDLFYLRCERSATAQTRLEHRVKLRKARDERLERLVEHRKARDEAP
jgi:hypothetical protein